jgi:hypothetical protein
MNENLVEAISADNLCDPGEEGVVLAMSTITGSVHAGILPGVASRYPDEIRERLVELQAAAFEIQRLREWMDEEAPMLRDMGVSWRVLGFAAMLDGSSAQRRWGRESE